MNPFLLVGKSFKTIINLMRDNRDDRRESKFVIVLYYLIMY